MKLKSCKNLINADTFDFSDPYVTMSVGKQTMKSRVIMDSLNPVWNQTLSFSWDGYSDLIATVLDKDTFGKDDHLGKVTVNLRQALAAGKKVETGEIEVDLDLPLANVEKGTIQFTVMYLQLG